MVLRKTASYFRLVIRGHGDSHFQIGQLMDPLTGAVLLVWPMSVRYYRNWVSPYEKSDKAPYCVFQAGKQTFKDRYICAMVWCIVNIGNGYELNNNKGKTDWNI